MDIVEVLQTTLRRLTIAMIVMYLVVVALGTFVWVQRQHDLERLQAITVSTNAALCTFRGDLEHRVSQGEEFLARHPNGVDGIEPSVIRQSLTSERETISALSSLNCSQGPT